MSFPNRELENLTGAGASAAIPMGMHQPPKQFVGRHRPGFFLPVKDAKPYPPDMKEAVIGAGC